MAKTHRHNTIQTKTQQTQDAALRPEWTGRRVSSRLLPGRSEPTDSDAGQTDVSVDPARRNDRRSTLRSAGNSSCWSRSSQQPAAAALTMQSYTSPHRVSQTQRYHSAHTVEPNLTRLFTRLPHATNTSVLEHGLNQLSSLAKFSRKPTKHVLFM